MLLKQYFPTNIPEDQLEYQLLPAPVHSYKPGATHVPDKSIRIINNPRVNFEKSSPRYDPCDPHGVDDADTISYVVRPKGILKYADENDTNRSPSFPRVRSPGNDIIELSSDGSSNGFNPSERVITPPSPNILVDGEPPISPPVVVSGNFSEDPDEIPNISFDISMSESLLALAQDSQRSPAEEHPPYIINEEGIINENLLKRFCFSHRLPYCLLCRQSWHTCYHSARHGARLDAQCQMCDVTAYEIDREEEDRITETGDDESSRTEGSREEEGTGMINEAVRKEGVDGAGVIDARRDLEEEEGGDRTRGSQRHSGEKSGCAPKGSATEGAQESHIEESLQVNVTVAGADATGAVAGSSSNVAPVRQTPPRVTPSPRRLDKRARNDSSVGPVPNPPRRRRRRRRRGPQARRRLFTVEEALDRRQIVINISF